MMAWSPPPNHPAHGDSSVKRFQFLTKEPAEEDFLLRRYCPEISSLVLSMLFSFQICRNMASSVVFSEQYHSQLKNKKTKVELFLPVPSASVPVTQLCRSSEGSRSFPCRVEVHLSARLSPCHVSQYRWVDRAACLSSPHFLGQPLTFPQTIELQNFCFLLEIIE